MKDKDIPLARDLFVATQLLGAARQLYSETKAVIPVSGSVYEHVLDDTLQIANVKLPGQT